MRIALCALEPSSTDSLGIQHQAKFESVINIWTFETNTIITTPDISVCIVVLVLDFSFCFQNVKKVL